MSTRDKFDEWWNKERFFMAFDEFKHIALEAFQAGYKERKAEDDRFDAFMRKRFADVVPDLCSGSWEDIWERVRDKFKEGKK